MATRTFHPVEHTSECHIRYSHGSNLLENVFAYRWNASTPTEAQLLSLATELATTLASRIGAQMHNQVVFREVYCRNIDTEIAREATYVFPSGTTATRSGNPVASNEAANVVKRTGFTGRSHHGAARFSEFVESDVDGNTLGSFVMGQLASICVSIITARVSGFFSAALASRKTGTSYPITTALTLDNNVDSQKSRLNNHGR